MFCEDIDTLHDLAYKIGLKRRWFQCERRGRPFPHYDVVASRRREAVRRGAVEIEFDEAVTLWRAMVDGWEEQLARSAMRGE